jgi:hypothetical protein
MTHCLHGGDNHGNHNGFTALGKTIGTSKSTETDADYVTEHRVLKYLRKKMAHYLHKNGPLPAKMAHYLFRIRVKTDEKDRNGRSVLMDCDCAMIDCLHDYAPGR